MMIWSFEEICKLKRATNQIFIKIALWRIKTFVFERQSDEPIVRLMKNVDEDTEIVEMCKLKGAKN